MAGPSDKNGAGADGSRAAASGTGPAASGASGKAAGPVSPRGDLSGSAFWTVAALPLVFLALLLARVPLANGPRFWAWPYVSLNVFRTALCFLPPLLLLAAGFLRAERRGFAADPGALLLLALANFALQLAGVFADPRGWSMIAAITASPAANGYFMEAMDITGSPLPLLRTYHAVDMNIHAQTHPPGPILFYLALIRMFGPGTAAWLGGCLLGAVAAAGVVLMARFAALWTEDLRAQFLAACLYALFPGLVLFFPELDQVYPLFTMAFLLLWIRCLEGPPRSALLLGTAALLASLIAYHILSVAFVLALFALLTIRQARDRSGALRGILLRAAIALAVVLVGQILFSVITGYHPILAFRKALDNERLIREALKRPLGLSLLWDLYDLLLAGAFVAAGLLFLYARRTHTVVEKARGRILTLCGLSLPLLLTFAALMHGENARLWLFLQPFLLAPAALPLASLRRRETIGVLLLLWVALVVMKSRLLYIGS